MYIIRNMRCAHDNYDQGSTGILGRLEKGHGLAFSATFSFLLGLQGYKNVRCFFICILGIFCAWLESVQLLYGFIFLPSLPLITGLHVLQFVHGFNFEVELGAPYLPPFVFSLFM